jgi:excisionase family DNA binding protein
MNQINLKQLKTYLEEICNRVYFGREHFEVVDGDKQWFKIVPLGVPNKFGELSDSQSAEEPTQPIKQKKRGRPKKTSPSPPPSPALPSKRIYILEEAAELLNVYPEYLRIQAFKGKIHGIKIGSRWRFTPEDLQKYAQEKAQEKAKQITIKEAAKILEVDENLVRREAAKGRIKHTRIGRRFLFTPEEIERILREGLP